MELIEKTRKMNVAQALIGKIREEHEESKIRTGILDDFKDPEKITGKGDRKKGFVPDVVSETGEGTDLYEIELYEQNYVLEKWRTFSDFSQNANGSFNIVVPKSNMDTLKDMLDLNEIHANIIYYYT